jgi:hypothetical protein
MEPRIWYPPGGVHEVLRVIRQRLDPDRCIAIVHCNPVFSAQSLTPKSLSPLVPTLGLREAEDLPTALAVARVAEGGTIGELEAYLADRLLDHKLSKAPINPDTINSAVGCVSAQQNAPS